MKTTPQWAREERRLQFPNEIFGRFTIETMDVYCQIPALAGRGGTTHFPPAARPPTASPRREDPVRRPPKDSGALSLPHWSSAGRGLIVIDEICIPYSRSCDTILESTPSALRYYGLTADAPLAPLLSRIIVEALFS
ncbi:hypothetical protein EVAR_29248_1 [Eumeta japonica]|uniref:Uncharacterized protein n=1 Tax=Eumeta variegata TaxID=151549 RepID=A0A4C1VKA8_EUMVA|nr:hypothetical protein EVAR_29248_1 [Eumeta japonica]